jgi:uncharacterized protein YggE
MRTIVCVIAVLAGAVSAAAQDPAAPSLIVTTGEATVRRPPDVAYIGIAVETRERTSREAQSANADIAAAVVKRLSDAGIARDALKTTGLRLEQEFDYNNGRRTPRGYVARNSIEVRVDDVAKAGDISDAAVQAGATSIEGIRFDLKDHAGAEQESLRLAVADARARAGAIAAGAGRTLDRIVRIEESRNAGYEPKVMPMMAARAVAEAAPTPVEPGFIEVHARVVLTVAMR